MTLKNEISYTQEILRKLIHLCSLSIPILYIFITKELALTILLPMTAITVIFDILARLFPSAKKLMIYLFGDMLRNHEKGEKFVLNGASWVLISAVVTIFIFPKIIAVTGFAILIISDISAALFGRKFGKRKFLDKSLEGSFAFAITAFLVVLIIGINFNCPWTYYFFGLLASIIGATVEAASIRLKVDDNLSIPLSIGIVLWIGAIFSSLINFPYLNII